MLYEYSGVVYPSRSKMCVARREYYVELLRQGLNFTQAAKVVGVSKRTGKVWRNGRTCSSGRNEKASVAWYCAKMQIPENMALHKKISTSLDMDVFWLFGFWWGGGGFLGLLGWCFGGVVSGCV